CGVGDCPLFPLPPPLPRRPPDFPRLVGVLQEALRRVRRPLFFLPRSFAGAARAGDDDRRPRNQRPPMPHSRYAHGLCPPPAPEVVFSKIRVTNTPRSKRMRSPESRTSMRLALMVHVAVFTSTGLSETIWLPPKSTAASLRNA